MTEIHTISFKCCDWCINLVNYPITEGVTFENLQCINTECCFFQQDHYSILDTFSKIGIHGSETYRALEDKKEIKAAQAENSRKFSEILRSASKIK